MSVRTERHWAAANLTMSELDQGNVQLVIHQGIEIELLDTLSSIHHREIALQIVHSFAGTQSAGRLEIVQLSNPLIDRAKNLYAARRDKEWGLTDCISFVLMSELGIHEAFTLDPHFIQAGFHRLIPVD